MIQSYTKTSRVKLFSVAEIGLIIILACIPLFLSFPYRVNIFLSWEGAYRLSLGQIPYKDFGMPLGYMYWVIPATFFKIFGAQMITLVKAQVFINIISGLAFRAILKNISVQPGIRFLSVVLYCISFSFFNFWPWYNHTVIVYQMAGLAFLTRYIFMHKPNWLWLFLSALFIFFSVFTKQDGGGLALMLSIALLLYHCFTIKKIIPLIIFLGCFIGIAFAFIAPLTRYNFTYWFNFGQSPHISRISTFEIIDEFFTNSQWIKFYLFIILLLIVASYKNLKEILAVKKDAFFLLLTLGILAEASILQVTSYTPPDNNIFFHSFSLAFLLTFLNRYFKINFSRTKFLLIGLFGVLLWWSGVFWKYTQRIVERAFPKTETAQTETTENIVNRKTYMIDNDTTDLPMSEWIYSNLKSFEKIYMPKQTVDGLQRLMNMDMVQNNQPLSVLNLTELTPLAVEIPYTLETGPEIPLWHHLGVAMFNKEAKMYETKIKNKKYNLVLFEHIPTLNNFYPFRVRDSLLSHYHKIDSFPAPRRGETKGMIEVFIPK